MRYPSLSPTFHEVVVVWLVAALTATAVVGLASVLVASLDPLRWWASRRQGRAMRAFATAIAAGDMARAEAEAGRAFGDGQPDVGVRASSARRRVGQPSGLASWDDHVVVGCSLADITAQIGQPQGVARWFPVSRAEVSGRTEFIADGLRMEVLLERWEGDCMTFQAVGAGASMAGYLTLRTVMLPDRGEGVEVWVHVEVPASRRGRRVMRMARSVTRTGLRQLAAGLGRS
jgi:hypothetical protein